MKQQRNTNQPVFELCCVGPAAHQFFLAVERREDISVTTVANLEDHPLVLFRDRTLVQCPYCKSHCYQTGMRATIEVTYTPEAVTR